VHLTEAGSLAGTLREARATEAMLSAKGVRRSSPTNWLSCECVRLAKMTCMAARDTKCDAAVLHPAALWQLGVLQVFS
jgi:hypothetical protein